MTFTCSKLTIETPQQCVKSVPISRSQRLTKMFNRFHTVFVDFGQENTGFN